MAYNCLQHHLNPCFLHYLPAVHIRHVEIKGRELCLYLNLIFYTEIYLMHSKRPAEFAGVAIS